MALQKEYRHEMAGGDLGKMRRLYREWTRAANERIRVTAPKEGGQAYRKLVKPLEGASYVKYDKHGNIIFKGLGKKPTDKTVREAFHALSRFMEAKTSTVAGIKAVEKERQKMLEKSVEKENNPVTVTEEEKSTILRWLGTDEGKTAMGGKFDSDLIIIALMLDVSARPEAGTIRERWQAFEERQTTLSRWIAGNRQRLTKQAKKIPGSQTAVRPSGRKT